MANIFGVLGLDDTDYVWTSTVGQESIHDHIADYVTRRNQELMNLMSVFVSGMTEAHKERYFLPGGGYLEELGQAPIGQAAAVKTSGSWDTAYPLASYGAQVADSRVSRAYMTAERLSAHIDNVVIRNVNTVRHYMLKVILNNVQQTFVDENWGSLSIEPLANGDTVVFPPVEGSDTEATEDHYLESNYLTAAISDTNNPYVTIEADLVHHFGRTQGNDNVLVLIHTDEKASTENLTDFTELDDRFTQPGTQTAQLTGLPTTIPGRVIGRSNGCWISQWDWVPSGYMIGVMLDEDPPLKMRTDPASVGLGAGLQLIGMDDKTPTVQTHWEHRFGFGAGNRLNGVVLELGTGGTYSIPSGYS